MNRILMKKTVALLTASALFGSMLEQGVYAAADGTANGGPIQPGTLHSLIASANVINAANISAMGPSGNGEPVVSSAIDTKSAAKINVIVQLSRQPLAVGQYAAKHGASSLAAESTSERVQEEQSSFLSAAKKKGIPLTVNYQYDTVFNGMEVTVTAKQIPELAKLAGVRAIHENYLYYPLADEKAGPQAATPITPPDGMVPLKQMGVDQAWAQHITGKGMKVGVLDTGIDYDHPDLKGAFKGGYDSFYQDEDPYEEEPSGLNHGKGSFHGTHVAGTIAGRPENPDSAVRQTGVAYDADLYSYKVLGGASSTGDAYGTSASIIDGIEHAVKDGMDVINMSLGSAMEKDPDSPDSIAVNNAVLNGVVVVIANGNEGSSGPYYYSMGSPANAQLALSVAAATSDGIRVAAHAASAIAGSSVPNADHALAIMSWETSKADFASILGTAPLSAIYVGLGEEADYGKLDVSGKLVFISRGRSTFEDKILLAKAHGAKAAVIFNGNITDSGVPDLSANIDQRNGPIGDVAFLGDSYEYLPAFDMAGSEGRALARELKNHPGESLTFKFDANFAQSIIPGDHIADFSSRGPNADGNYSIKPDVSAPGVNILSTYPAFQQVYPDNDYSKAYRRLSGTSMASPHVAGLALLLLQAHPAWTPTDVRAALANTADELKNETGTLYDVYSQGAGRVNVVNALKTPALLKSLDKILIYDKDMKPNLIDSEASSVSFGALEAGAKLDKPLELENTSGQSLTYQASVRMHSAVTSDPAKPIATPDVDDIAMTLGGAGGSPVTSVAVGPNAKTDLTLTADVLPGAKNGVYEGEVVLTSADLPTLHLPFVVHVGKDSDVNEFGLKDVSLTSKQIGEGLTTELSATLNSNHMNYIDLELLDMKGNYIGTMGDYYDYNEAAQGYNDLPAGRFAFEDLDGSYYNGEIDRNGEFVVHRVPDGMYKLNINALHFLESHQYDEILSTVNTVYVKFDGTPDPGEPPIVIVPGPGSGSADVPAEPTKVGELPASVVDEDQTAFVVKADVKRQGDTASASVTDADLQKALVAAKQKQTAFVVDASTSGTKGAEFKLTASQVDLLKGAAAGGSVVLAWNDSSVAFPLSALSQAPVGAELAITVKQDEGSKAIFTKAYSDATVLGTPYAFEASYLVNGVATPVELTAMQTFKRSFLLEKGIDASSAGVLYAEDDEAYAVPARTSTAANGQTIVTIARPGYSTYAVAKHSSTFKDIGSSWAKTQIQSLVNRFILSGTSSTTFSPKAITTRAQFTAMLVRALGLQKHSALSTFSDVSDKDWYAQDVAAGYEAGLVTGSNGKFNPNAPLSRQDMTVLLYKAMKLTGLSKSVGTGGNPYADNATISAYAQESVQAVTDAGLMNGVELKGQFFFQPTGGTTREAAAKVLYAFLLAANLTN
ncbi:S8 family serine peptidase [Paenibacillus glycinis]|uniref:S8 family serine peptidase n=1 Tax=Paenibacillus glycinis TaxID=2697035 RepID=A0ABW9Y086_9BACL|nr:S8 family serine peptidase [Paenibacillus glycinis]NBD28366.1 S8 family serine peptidase [Paenibacillus glycinis]